VNASEQQLLDADLIVKNAGELITCARDDATPDGRSSLGRIENGAIAAREERIVWVGEASALRENVRLVEGEAKSTPRAGL